MPSQSLALPLPWRPADLSLSSLPRSSPKQINKPSIDRSLHQEEGGASNLRIELLQVFLVPPLQLIDVSGDDRLLVGDELPQVALPLPEEANREVQISLRLAQIQFVERLLVFQTTTVGSDAFIYVYIYTYHENLDCMGVIISINTCYYTYICICIHVYINIYMYVSIH